MGDERNANVSVFIQNSAIADAFLAEFAEMWTTRKLTPDEKAKIDQVYASGMVPGGAFHGKKKPNTKRYFRFEDGTEVKVLFSPTDDAVHRSVIPLLLSAKPKDEIRISMFGTGNIEIVRAIQFAVANGARVRIVLDRTLAGGADSWIKLGDGNLDDENPFPKKGQGSLEVRLSTWPGDNHQKVATLTRDGTAGEILLGSLNWSKNGNDDSDENLIHVRNLGSKGYEEVSVAAAFNNHFDKELWPVSEAKISK
jgi:phosphatidylserine/phosphatidylglycerophosphate/cardiolipin synthase-like enzyme